MSHRNLAAIPNQRDHRSSVKMNSSQFLKKFPSASSLDYVNSILNGIGNNNQGTSSSPSPKLIKDHGRSVDTGGSNLASAQLNTKLSVNPLSDSPAQSPGVANISFKASDQTSGRKESDSGHRESRGKKAGKDSRSSELRKSNVEPVTVTHISAIVNEAKALAKMEEELEAVEFNNDPAAERFLQLSYVCGFKIRIEKFKAPKGSPQCHRYQPFGHVDKACHMPAKCVKCDLGNFTRECVKPNAEPAVCANCGGKHPANYRGCPVYQKRKLKIKMMKEKARLRINVNKIADIPRNLNLDQNNFPALKNNVTNVSYARVASMPSEAVDPASAEINSMREDIRPQSNATHAQVWETVPAETRPTTPPPAPSQSAVDWRDKVRVWFFQLVQFMTQEEWNANGIFNKMTELSNVLHAKNIDVAMIAETHLTADIGLDISGFTCIRKENTRKIGRACILVSTKLKTRHLKLPKFKNLQAAGIQIVGERSNFNFIAAYNSPSKRLLKTDFYRFAGKFSNTPTINGGDLNAKNKT
ncbi:hypothetical protein J437_LFUL019310 [Ladona fulva]|uniref:Gag-like protein n=1 Tax=Ladona fulva TaxID=123851 RepID=A0A8K0KQD3_LADFU|nr:hypothetical protein J437_LFUL019310 [Ladona fulva]